MSLNGDHACLNLSTLLEALPVVQGRVGGDAVVYDIVADSRQVEPGALFVAVPGVNVDGHRFIAEAVDSGAVAVVGQRPPQALTDVPWGAFTYVRVPDARAALGWLCAAWYGFPSRRMTLIGVTGTDGKTTTVNLIYAILQAAGIDAGMISTVNARIGGREVDTGFHVTTPDAPDIQRYLCQMVQAGATHAVLEVTSHGLAQRRVAGCDFDVAVVTNITHEHLDAHGSFEAYRRAKASLFDGLSGAFRKPTPDGGSVPKAAVLNRDDAASFDYLRAFPVDRTIVYGMGPGSEITARDVRFDPDATRFTLRLAEGEVAVRAALVGAYNVSNMLAAASVGEALGIPLQAIEQGIAALEAIPGRMERIDEGQDFLAVVDFAHTPNALENVLRTARAMVEQEDDATSSNVTATSRVILVLGSAGLRDREKRGMMGHIAGRLADVVIVTAEDPRTESLEQIMAHMAAAAVAEGKRQGIDLWCIPDRGQAILKACQLARTYARATEHTNCMVLVCGKGHEQSMCFGTVEYPWDDREALRRALRGETLDTLPTSQALSFPFGHPGK